MTYRSGLTTAFLRLKEVLNSTRFLPFVSLAYLLVSLIQLAISGPVYGGDSRLYVDNAALLMAGEPVAPITSNYYGYLLLVGFFRDVMKAGDVWLIVFQILLRVAALAGLYRVTERLYGRPQAAVCVLLFLAYPRFHWFNFYILTDSVFVSCVILSAWMTGRFLSRPTPLSFLGALSLALSAGAIRVNGWFLLPLFLSVSAFSCFRKRAMGWAALGALWPLFFYFFFNNPLSTKAVSYHNPYALLTQGKVIYWYEGWKVEMEGSDTEISGAVEALRFVARNVTETVHLALWRAGSCLSSIRPFFSLRNNMVTGAFLFLAYLGFVAGVRRAERPLLKSFLLAWIGLQLALVMATFDDWDGRFLMYFLPFILVFSGGGVVRLLQWASPTQGAAIKPLTRSGWQLEADRP